MQSIEITNKMTFGWLFDNNDHVNDDRDHVYENVEDIFWQFDNRDNVNEDAEDLFDEDKEGINC